MCRCSVHYSHDALVVGLSEETTETGFKVVTVVLLTVVVTVTPVVVVLASASAVVTFRTPVVPGSVVFVAVFSTLSLTDELILSGWTVVVGPALVGHQSCSCTATCFPS